MKRLWGVGAVLVAVLLVGVLQTVQVQAAPQVIGYGKNLIANGNAEANRGGMSAGSGPAPRLWKRTGPLEVIKYGALGGFPLRTSPGPRVRGLNFFSGGYTPSTQVRAKIEQSFSVVWAAPVIDRGKARYTLSGYFGGFGSDPDNARLQMKFYNAAGRLVGKKTIGPVTPLQRGGVTGLWPRSASALVPKRTRKVKVELILTHVPGSSYNDGYADNLSLVFRKLP